MKEIIVYAEGGGPTSTTQAALRRGFDEFFRPLKIAAAEKRLSLRFVCRGGRHQAYKDFVNKYREGKAFVTPVLLVDSEVPPPHHAFVPIDESENDVASRLKKDAEARKRHLLQRPGDQWDLQGVSAEQIHLVGVCMESILCADPDALANYYGKDFHLNRLPQRINLEDEEKVSIYKKLANATRDSKKGEYSEAQNAKIEHGSKLLSMLDLNKVRKRCPHINTFVEWIEKTVNEA